MKYCLFCNSEIADNRKFCSPSCSLKYHPLWNKGKTKKDDLRLVSIGHKSSIRNKGKISNKRGKTFLEIYGEDRSKDIRNKISISTKNTMSNIILPSTGRTYLEIYGEEKSLEIKNKMSISHKGMNSFKKGLTYVELYGEERSNNLRDLLSVKAHLRTGIISSNWQGGKSFEIYPREFTLIKRTINIRDKIYRLCGKENIVLHTHHIDYDKNNNSPLNLISLCINCHGKTQGNRQYWEFLLKFFMHYWYDEFGINNKGIISV